MIIYEVNLVVQPDIYADYYQWLITHIKTILKFDGFVRAELSQEKDSNSQDQATKLSVRYCLESAEHLDSYFNKHAQAMREDGIQRFGDKFTATRRIFANSMTIEK